MDLPNLFSAQKKSDSPAAVIGILLSETKVQAVLLEINHDKLAVNSSSDIIEYTDNKNCLIQTDEALQQLGKESEAIDKVIFGLNHNWVADGEVVSQHQSLLKQLTDELSLEPIGFIDNSEALAQHFITQNNLYSGVLVLFSTTALTVSYVSQGKIKGVEQVGRSDDVVADLREGLARFSQQVQDKQFYLPAKLTLASFDLTNSQLQEMKQELLEFNWTDQARFLQMPTIQIMSDQQFTTMAAREAARAAAIAAGFYNAAATASGQSVSSQEAEATSKEMGFEEVSPADDQQADNQENNQDSAEAAAMATQTAAAAATASSAPQEGAMNSNNQTTTAEPETAEPDTAHPTAAQSSGPQSGPGPAQPDQSTQTKKQENQESNIAAMTKSVATSFGVPISSDKVVDSQKSLEQLEREAQQKQSAAGGSGDGGAGFFANLRARWNEPYKGNRSLKFFIFTGFFSGLVVLLLAFAGIIYFTAEAQIEVTVEPQPVSQEVGITLDSEATEPDAESLVLPANSVTKTVSGQDTTATTGVALVGDEATGTVTIYNKTTAEKTFEAGTVVSNGDLEFTLDEEVSVASASVKEDSPEETVTSNGSADVPVTATDIGADYNLEADTELTVDNFASETYSAVVAGEGLSGGASREVQVVAPEDRQRLLQDLRSSLLEEANNQFAEESGNGQYILSTSNITAESVNFAAEVEDEVTEFSLDLEITVEALAYNTADLKPLAQAVLASEIPDGYQLSQEEPQILSAPATEEATSGAQTVEIEANISSVAHPVLKEDELAAEISGQDLTAAREQLESRPEIQSVTINWQPRLAGFIRSKLPSQEKITININVN